MVTVLAVMLPILPLTGLGLNVYPYTGIDPLAALVALVIMMVALTALLLPTFELLYTVPELV